MNPIPRPEHPDPRFQRQHWLTLNGPWHFAFDPRTIGEQQRWYQPSSPFAKNLTISVPFPWESKLSGVERPDYKGAAWYEREMTVPAEWTGLVPYLNFGAIDWQARVWVNGKFAGEHENGYLPFSLDLSRFVQPGQTATITVRAYDVADASTLVGKQVPRWYTHSSGIWQSVWLEGRAANHLIAIRVEPDIVQGTATVKLSLSIAAPGSYRLRLSSPEDAFAPSVSKQHFTAGHQQQTVILSIPKPKLWSPESPHLYELLVELEPLSTGVSDGVSDQVMTYFGLRSISRGKWADNDYEYILLNGEPVYLRGALDQAFHPDSLHAYPSDEVIRGDIALAKDLGLNMLRCHIKINDPRYYYWADQLGLLILYDIPSPDLDTPTMRRIFEEALPRAIQCDFNSPSICAWILFNETWGLTEHQTSEGQTWLKEMVARARQLDPTRLIEDNSPCLYDHVETDINSWHFYINDYQRVRQHIQRVVDETYPGSRYNYIGGHRQTTAPLINSEYGGISARMGDQDISWCFKYQTNELRRHNKICGYVYTELDDIEWEHNGFVNYDRSAKWFGYDFYAVGMLVRDLNSADYIGFDAPPCQSASPGSQVQLPIFVSHWGAPVERFRLRWKYEFLDRFGNRRVVDKGMFWVQPRRFEVVNLEPLRVTLPNENGLVGVALWLEDEAGHVYCRNFSNIEVRNTASPLVERLPNGWALRIEPGKYSQCDPAWPQPFTESTGAKFAATRSGWVAYQLALPGEIKRDAVQRLSLIFEASAKAGMAKVDWPQQTYGANYPQTELERRFRSDLVVSLNGVVIGQMCLPDDPADARGVLSHYRGVDPGSYGDLTELTVEGEMLQKVLANGTLANDAGSITVRFTIPDNAGHRGGLALYGETLGCYPVAPTLVVEVGG